MKKKVFLHLVFIVSALLTTATSQAQGIKFGVKGGFNITQMSLGSEVLDANNKYGFFIGPVVKASLPVGIGIDVAGLYDERNAELDGVKMTMKNLNVPLNLRFNVGLGGIAGAYMTVGPQFSFNLGDRHIALYKVGESVRDLRSLRLRDSYLSANMGAGIYLTHHFEIGAIYNIAIDKTGDLEGYTLNDALQTRASAWQIVASVYF